MIGICNPHSFELPQYQGYDITKWKGNMRFMEIVLNRNGNANGICPLIFNGALNQFTEAPLPTETSALTRAFNWLIQPSVIPPLTQSAPTSERAQPSISLWMWAFNKLTTKNKQQN